jgi:hypothetical protein
MQLLNGIGVGARAKGSSGQRKTAKVEEDIQGERKQEG